MNCVVCGRGTAPMLLVGETPAGPVFACAEHTAEPPEVTAARKVLAESRATAATGDPADPARWWGRLEVALESLLAHIDGEGLEPPVPAETARQRDEGGAQ